MTNKQIARALKETASLLELAGENPFRTRAFAGAARTIERMEESAAARLEAGTLTQIRGIGDGLAAQIGELVARGSFDLRDELFAALPPELPALLRVKGLGAKKVRQLWQELDITTLDELEAAAATGRLADLAGFGEKTQEKILANVAQLRRYEKRRHYASIALLVEPVLSRLRAEASVVHAEPTGALRRKLETLAEAELIVAATDPSRVAAALDEWLTAGPEETEDGDLHLVGDFADGLPLRVLVVPPERFGTAWWRSTGSEAHVAAFEKQYGPPAVCADEATLFDKVGLSYIEPELREAQGELVAAAEGPLPDLITVADLQGTLHNHSTYSDGSHTLEQMAEAARALGLSYFGICDHSQSLTIASGLSVESVLRQQEEIRRLNAAYEEEDAGFRILSGIECDILADGSLDYPEEILAGFDFLVASVHSGFNMTEDEATRRIVRAVENPYTSILGHATGRLLLRREGYPLDHMRVIDACAANGVAIELNANPWRLDVDWRWLRRATEAGVLVSINPDAHSIEELDNVRWGVAVARKGWLTPEQCLNARSLDEITEWFASRGVKTT